VYKDVVNNRLIAVHELCSEKIYRFHWSEWKSSLFAFCT